LGTEVNDAVRAAQHLSFSDSHTTTDLRVYDLRDYTRVGVFPIVGVTLTKIRAVHSQHAQVVAYVTSHRVQVHDPLYGRMRLPTSDFEEAWALTGYQTIIVM
jgi:predicted double-glycine peptidase